MSLFVNVWQSLGEHHAFGCMGTGFRVVLAWFLVGVQPVIIAVGGRNLIYNPHAQAVAAVTQALLSYI
eukprot:6209072-Pleurochrysis_carterae.AAC.2